MKKLLIPLTAVLFLSSCESSTATNQGTKMNSSYDQEIKLPTDRRLSFNEAMNLRASDLNLRIYDEERMELLHKYAKDPKEINAQYAWATYQLWHVDNLDVETQGYQKIFELAKIDHPYACADVYTWSYQFDNDFIKNTMKINKKNILAIKDNCLEIALKYNANSIKHTLIEKFFSDYRRGDEYDDYNILSYRLMQDVDKQELNRVKEYLLMYLFSWDNQFMNSIPSNNLANGNLVSFYLQILAYDPYDFNVTEACAWLKYYDQDFIPYLKENNLPNLKIIQKKLVKSLPILRDKIKDTEINIQQCQSRYIEIRDTKRNNDPFELDFN
ncbi:MULTISPECIES: hypothetical protein [Psychrobacter]|uniref:hypothetical protein n=1 Tax=Psychrobacter TaxID=497 RepID=UPI000C324FD4|nr:MULTISPECIES: hypothetical protein [Psychrobacter]PKG36768.1 hypothetical protein CXF65_00650 [Psychrobacter sp. Sarcosine-3u-12]